MDSLRFLLRDRDWRYTRSFDAVFEADDVEILLSPPRAPRANAICERVVGTLRREILDRILIYNEAHAHAVLTASHQALQPAPPPPIPTATTPRPYRTARPPSPTSMPIASGENPSSTA
jgi:transposase InsO family protein